MALSAARLALPKLPTSCPPHGRRTAGTVVPGPDEDGGACGSSRTPLGLFAVRRSTRGALASRYVHHDDRDRM